MKMNKKRFMNWQREIVDYFLPYIKAERSKMVVLFSLDTVMIAANTILIWMLGVVITQLTEGNYSELNVTLFIIAGIVLFNQLIQYLYTYIFQQLTLRFVDRVRGQLLWRIMQISFPINNQFDKGDLISRLNNNVDRILAYVVNVPLDLASNIIMLVLYGSMLFWIDWRLTLVALTLAPFFFLSQRFVAPRTGAASRQFVQEKAKLMSIEEQTLANLRSISAFNNEDTIRQKHSEQFRIARVWAYKMRKISMLYNSFFTFLLYFAGVVVVYSGISSIQSGELTVGVLVSFLVYIRNLAGPVRGIAQIPIQLQSNRAAAERVMEVLRTESAIKESDTNIELNISVGEVAFNDVTFSYPNSKEQVFSHFSAAIHAGESVALVGSSGTGKSTCAALLLRFYDPQEGFVSIDGVDIKSVSQTSLRSQISIVWQEPFFINGSIKENLLLAKSDATTEQMISACKSSFSWEFVNDLDDGLETIIGANGINLSVGQIQRLAIAQAFLRDTPILILDEASSALDSHSEKMVVEALQSLRRNRTTIIIAHRYSSIRSANRILYFNGEGTVTSGTHDELMLNNTDYKDAVNWQISHDPP